MIFQLLPSAQSSQAIYSRFQIEHQYELPFDAGFSLVKSTVPLAEAD
jgi:hypothetical protein